MTGILDRWAQGRTADGQLTLYFKEIESTNGFAMETAKNCPHGTVIIADSQTGGKGRLGRCWESPPGANIYMSVVIKPGIRAVETPVISLLAGVASAVAIKKIARVGVDVKWPNDLMVSGKKLGGILVETRSSGRPLFAVIGIGINVNKTPSGVRSIATSLFDVTGKKHDRVRLAEAILEELKAGLDNKDILLRGALRQI